ncbi:MAG: TonB-dependent receptor [Calditrichaeota bacterium]|nr:TonB-dependent receptor [Calditrichota bacterium]
MTLRNFKKIIEVFSILLLLGNISLFAQTTGKIVGLIIDGKTNEPLVGANVMIEGLPLGASTDANGEYFIINVPPGTYTIRMEMLGYNSVLVEDVRVSVNRTAHADATMTEAIMEGETIVVTAEKVAFKKDQTSSIKNVSSEQIEALPVESVDQVIEMQAGIVAGHFRGGRTTEVSYLIDGIQADESISRSGSTVQMETEAVQDLEVITGTFNAEYGRAMSGIVNLVTKEGSNEFHGSASGYISNYYLTSDKVFVGLKNSDIARNQDYKIQLEGPVMKNVTFFTNFRHQENLGYLNGIRRFDVDNYTDLFRADLSGANRESPWDVYIDGEKYYSEHTGNNKYVPMQWQTDNTFLGKLTFRLIPTLKFSVMYSYNSKDWQNYNHSYKYNPDGIVTTHDLNHFVLFQVNQTLSQSIFHDFKVSYTDNWYGSYLYENPFDSRYVANNYSASADGFISGGQDKSKYQRYQKNLNIKYDIIWQAHNSHNLKSGFLFTQYDIKNDPTVVRDIKFGTSDEGWFRYDTVANRIVFKPYEPEILPDSSVSVDRFSKKPYEFSAYMQDKMEFEDLVVNLGLRFDYFNPNTVYPTQLRNPANQLSFPDNPERMSEYKDADPQMQLSPRFGLSYTLGKKAVLHFSYGHFFQMPPLYAMYQNSNFLVPPGDFDVIQGNPRIKAEKTVQYEMGVWQELIEGMGLELSVFYRDIYDLQSAIVVTTFNDKKYGLFSNKDYGNVKGLEVKFDYIQNPIALYLNYTLQYTRGNADNPASTFNRLGQSQDPIGKLIPMSWDQRHTLNLSAVYARDNFGITLTGYYNSGTAYTYVPVQESPLSKQTLYPNNASKPENITVDLKGNYDFDLNENMTLRLYLSIYNLLDQRNEISVNSTTGRAYTAVIHPSQIANFRSSFTDIYDSIQDPSMFSAPREVKLGLGIMF